MYLRFVRDLSRIFAQNMDIRLPAYFNSGDCENTSDSLHREFLECLDEKKYSRPDNVIPFWFIFIPQSRQRWLPDSSFRIAKYVPLYIYYK